jgi:hypothetical protein
VIHGSLCAEAREADRRIRIAWRSAVAVLAIAS